MIINGEIRDQVWKHHRSHRLNKIGVISPGGARIAFDINTIETYTTNGEARIFNYDTYSEGFSETLSYRLLIIGLNSRIAYHLIPYLQWIDCC